MKGLSTHPLRRFLMTRSTPGMQRSTTSLMHQSMWSNSSDFDNKKSTGMPVSQPIRLFSEAAASASATAANQEGSGGETSSSSGSISLSSPKLDKLYQDVTKLNEEEVHILGALIMQVLGRKLFPGEFGRGLEGLDLPVMAAAEEEEEKVEKTTFNVKLMGFDAKAKIKVIKEVRAIAGLGLKEAKELVESAPKVIGKDLKQDKADELKAQLEAVGAQIEFE